MGIGNCIANRVKESGGKLNFMDVLKGKGRGGIWGYKKGKTKYDNSRGSLAAAINAVSKDRIDNIKGALYWDGRDFWKLGFNHNKFIEFKGVIISQRHYSDVANYLKNYKNGIIELHNDFTTCDPSKVLYHLSYIFWFGNSKKYEYLYSTEFIGGTIFWGCIK